MTNGYSCDQAEVERRRHKRTKVKRCRSKRTNQIFVRDGPLVTSNGLKINNGGILVLSKI